ncbi:MAG: hypothetical protein HYU30_04875 [Chloroflexi bacterium]|nr:hypothetical protein [Chloroflexota bacterium]
MTQQPNRHPLAEVFGFPPHNLSLEAARYRRNRLCPFNNKVPNCTKDKANDPLGVCSIYDDNDVVITCPIRFRQDWTISDDAAAFFFPQGTNWTSLTEVHLKDRVGKAAGNIDIVLVSYDGRGRVIDFGALEIQAVYISGNIRRPFEQYLKDPSANHDMDWTKQPNYPRPDYLSSSRKRLVPQMIYKGGILRAWKRKMAVALNRGLYESLPKFTEVSSDEADIVWLVYDLTYNPSQQRYTLQLHKRVYVRSEAALARIMSPETGEEKDFLELLQSKLDDKLEDDNSPDAPTLDVLL